MRVVGLLAVVAVVAGAITIGVRLADRHAGSPGTGLRASAGIRARSAVPVVPDMCGQDAPIGGNIDGEPLGCAPALRHSLPPGQIRDGARAWPLGRLVLITPAAPTAYGYAIWRRHAGHWDRLVSGNQSPPGVQIGDVNQDGHEDVLLSVYQGSGLCGEKRLVALYAQHARTLFREVTCERVSNLLDGLLYVRTPFGPCADSPSSPHCARGTRVQILGWNGTTRTVNETIVRCLKPGLNPDNHCRAR